MNVFRGYDQDALDAQYNLRARHPDFQAHFDDWAARSARARQALPCRLDVPYGEAPGETLDVFPAARADAPVQVFIHGGYWQLLDKSDFSFLAEPWVRAGAAAVLVNYDLAPRVSMDEIVRQARAAVAWSCRHARGFGGDPERVYVSGHSAGGHLTAMALLHDWAAEGLPGDAVKGGVAISGLYELEPVRLTYLNEALQLDEGAARRNSPLHALRPVRAPLVVAVGGGESEEFLRHSATFAEAWRQQGNAGGHLAVPGHNHFTVLGELTVPGAPLGRALLEQMGLGAG